MYLACFTPKTCLIVHLQGQWSTTGVGPNAPLEDSCSTDQAGSATTAVKTWVAAGFPANKIVLGVPSYGHSFTVTPSNAVNSSGILASYPPFTKFPLTSTLDQCGNPEAQVDTMDFSVLISDGYLNDDGTASSEVTYRFDNCSQTVSLALSSSTSFDFSCFIPLALPL